MSKRWKPEYCDLYYVVDAVGVVSSHTWCDDTADRTYYTIGNCFRTSEEAEAAAAMVRALLLGFHGDQPEKYTKLPKLTADVFDRPDCPEWAKFAAVDEDGETTFFDKKPYQSTKTCGCFLRDCQYATIPSKFDASDWKNSLIERHVKKPKLTTDVFDREDCPEWARYAVVNSNGTLIFFGDKPTFEGEDYGCWSCSYCPYKHIRGIVFDSSDWKNSLIERPVKLPEWCKGDAIGWCERYGYFRVTCIDDYSEGVYVRRVDDKSKGYLSFRTVCSEATHTQLRPYNVDELKALVGKPITMSDGAVCLCTAYGKQCKSVILDNTHWNAQKLVDNGFTVDGEPCGVLQHLNEKGEWVD